MKHHSTIFLLCLFVITALPAIVYGQTGYAYEATVNNPYGKLNPAAPPQVSDYSKLIGTCDCQSISRAKDGNWADTVAMQWTFKYIMNGTGVQDETLKEDGTFSGSIRQYQSDSARWYVHYYSSASPGGQLPAWEGGMKGEEIVLYNRQPAPNGTDGYYKIRFYDISDQGFKWLGVWTDLSESIVFETWKIFCTKRKE